MATSPIPLTDVGQRLFDMLGALAEVSPAAAAAFSSALATMFDETGELLAGDDMGSQIFDPTLTPAFLLDWLAQFPGVTLEPYLSVPQQRTKIIEAPETRRGRPETIKGAAKPYLTGTQQVTLYERIGGSRYRYLVITYAAETAAPATVGLLETEYAGRTIADVEADFPTVGHLELQLSPNATALADALMRAKPGRFVFEHRVDDGWSVGQLEAAYAGQTIADLEGDYTDIEELETVIPNG